VYAGVLDMLAALRRMGLPLGLVTGKSRPAWEITASLVGLGPFRSSSPTRKSGRPSRIPKGSSGPWPSPGAPAEALYVGDSVGDAQAAHAAGMPFAAALVPKTREEREKFLAHVHPVGIWRELATPDQLIREIPDPARSIREPSREYCGNDQIPNDQEGKASV